MALSQDFLKCIGNLLKNQESCVISCGKTICYFSFKRGTQQGDPISAYLFIFVLEIVFTFIKESEKVQGLTILITNFYTLHTLMTLLFSQ